MNENESQTRAALTQIAERWMALLSLADMPAYEASFDALHADHFVDRSPGDRKSSREEFKRGLAEWMRAFQGISYTIDDLVIDVSKGKVAIRWSAAGEHCLPYMGFAATQRRVHFQGIEILRVERGQIVERWGEWDGLAVQAQLSAK